MLVLTRKEKESIIIGDDIEVRILGFDKTNGHIRVGIKAPKHIRIFRKECLEKMDKEVSDDSEKGDL